MPRTTVWIITAMSAFTATAASAQKFEVASIKPCKPDIAAGRANGVETTSPGRLRLDCTNVRGLIHMAYVLFADGHVNPPWGGSVPVNGGPPWIDADRYQIDAKAAGAASQGMMHRPILQALLEDRFKLKLHRATGEVPVYELTVAKSGHKMQPLPEGSCTPVDFEFLRKFPPEPLPELPAGQQYCGGVGSDGFRWLGSTETQKGSNVAVEVRGMNLDEVCKMVFGNRLDRPVVNKTGIAGRFVFRLEFAPDETTPRFQPAAEPSAAAALPDDPARGPSLFTAVQEQLGLKLVPAKGPGEFLVIDHVERPTKN